MSAAGAQRDADQDVRYGLRVAAGYAWRFIVVAIAVYAIFIMLGRIQFVGVALFVGLVISALLRPVADRLDTFLPRGLAVAVAMLLGIALVTAVFTFIIGSVAGLLIGGGKEAVYAATKGAQINLGTAMDRELRGEGIRTTVLAPAGVNTGFAAADGRFGDGDPEHGPFMEPSDIAGAVLYTLSQPRRMRTELWTMWSLAEVH